MNWRDQPDIAKLYDCHHIAHLYRDDGELLGVVMSFESNPTFWYAHSIHRRLGPHEGVDAAKRAVERSLEHPARPSVDALAYTTFGQG